MPQVPLRLERQPDLRISSRQRLEQERRVRTDAATALDDGIEPLKRNVHASRRLDLRDAERFEELRVAPETLADFSHRWRVTELALFGSVLRADFREDSNVDVLVTFEPDAQWNLFDLTTMQQKLAEVFGRPVDLVEEAALRNPYRREAILRAKHTLYAA